MCVTGSIAEEVVVGPYEEANDPSLDDGEVSG